MKKEKNKYKKISKQTKFEFLSRISGGDGSIRQVAQEMGIHYSTAKTILFFHRHSHRSYRKFKIKHSSLPYQSKTAGVKDLSPKEHIPNRIQLICNSHFGKWEPRKQRKSDLVSLTYRRDYEKPYQKTFILGGQHKEQKRLHDSRLSKNRSRSTFSSDEQEDSNSDSSFIYV